MSSNRFTCALLCTLALALACNGSIDGADDEPGGGKHGADADGGSLAGGGASKPVDCSVSHNGPRRLWRLTPEQYDNTIEDLFGLEGAWGQGFPADTVVNGFANNAAALLVTPLLASKLQDAAEDIAARADLSPWMPCAISAGDDACALGFIASFGKHAFRRPLSNADVARYDALRSHAASFEAGARLVVTAMLQSPHFLYRRELGTANGEHFELDDYEIASELSYLVWQSMPDAALFTAAEHGKLRSAGQIEAELTRMLAEPRVRPMLRSFVVEWLGLASIANVPKDTGTFPELTSEVRASMRGEVDRFIDYVLWQSDGTIDSLLTAPVSFVDDRLAMYYGVAAGTAQADAQGFRMLDLRVEERRGILTLGGVMMRHARSNDSSPVHRGRLVRERLLCQVPPPPPPGIVVQPPALDPSKTARERYAAHSKQQPCAGCHRLMDRIGFAFEHFDGAGRYRADDHGLAIDVSGEIVDSPSSNGTFDGTQELADKLATSADVRACVARQWTRYAYGIDDEAENGCVIERMLKDMSRADGSFSALLAQSALAEPLRMRDRGPQDDGTSTPGMPLPANDAGTSPDSTVAVPPASGPQHVELIDDNDYGSGYCHTYRVTNTGEGPLTWSVSLELGGTLMQSWESRADGTTGKVSFSGAEYNATLEPAASAQFGFCVTR